MNDRTRSNCRSQPTFNVMLCALKSVLGSSILMKHSNYVQVLLKIHSQPEYPYCNCVVLHQEKHLARITSMHRISYGWKKREEKESPFLSLSGILKCKAFRASSAFSMCIWTVPSTKSPSFQLKCLFSLATGMNTYWIYSIDINLPNSLGWYFRFLKEEERLKGSHLGCKQKFIIFHFLLWRFFFLWLPDL